jgi:hypothetical protein
VCALSRTAGAAASKLNSCGDFVRCADFILASDTHEEAISFLQTFKAVAESKVPF